MTEESLTDFKGIGDLSAVNLDDSVDWLSYLWHGHECRWDFGDTRWPVDDFRRVATAIIDNCSFQGSKNYQFNLLDNGTKLKRTLVTTDTSKSHSVQAAVVYIIGQAGLSISLINISSAKLAWNVAYDLTSTSTADTVLRDIAKSIGGFLRVDQIGNIDIIIPKDESVLTINQDQVSAQGARMVESIPPYTKVVVVKNDGTEITGNTGIDSGELDREIRIDTYLSSTADAEALRDELLSYYADSHNIWELLILGVSDILKCGVRFIIDHRDLRNSGIVNYIGREPLSSSTRVEVTV